MSVFKYGIGFLVGAATLITTLVVPTPPVEASSGNTAAAAIIGGVAGLIIGSEMERSNQRQARCRQHRCHQNQLSQRLLIREVLQNYRPECHDRFIEYVMFDLQGYITPAQQRQLLHTLEQRYHMAFYAPICR